MEHYKYLSVDNDTEHMICGAPFSQNGFTSIGARLAVLRKNVLAVPIIPNILCVVSLTEDKIIYAGTVDHKFTNHRQKLFIYAFNRKCIVLIVLIIQLMLSDLSGQFVHERDARPISGN